MRSRGQDGKRKTDPSKNREGTGTRKGNCNGYTVRKFNFKGCATRRCEKHCRGELCLDSAFVLIEDHPPRKFSFKGCATRPTRRKTLHRRTMP